MFREIRPFEAILDDLHDAIAWVEKRTGKRLNPNSRAMQYISDVNTVVETWQLDGGQTALHKHGARRLVNSLMEADAIGSVIRTIGDRIGDDRKLVRKIEESLYGPMHFEDEKIDTSSNKARNFFFELRLLEQLLLAGLPSKWGEKPDLQTEIDARPVYIECKRPFSRNHIRGLAKDGCHQLKQDFTQDNTAVGLVAFDFSRILPADQWYVAYSSRDDIRNWLASTQERIVSRFERDIMKAMRRKSDPRIVGMIQYFQFAIYNLTTGRWGTSWKKDFCAFRDSDPEGIVKKLFTILEMRSTSDQLVQTDHRNEV